VTTPAARAATLERALRAGLERDFDTIRALCTDDVRAWTPALATASRDELVDRLDARDESFSEFELDVVPIPVDGELACVEWVVGMTHTGPLAVAGNEVVEPTGLRITLHGVTVAEFRDDRICSLRQYWDELSAYEQLGLFDRDRA
jgi:ketosteroid isomerase-like protein